MYHTIYLCAGIIIPIQKEKYTTIKRSCGDHCINDGYKFCSQCGKEVKEVEVEEESYIWVGDLIGSENLTNKFNEDDQTVAIYSNLGIGQLDNNTNTPIAITKDVIESKINEFKEGHKKEIETLKDKLGFDIEVQFLFIHDYS